MEEKHFDTENAAQSVIAQCRHQDSVIGQTLEVTFEAKSAQIQPKLEPVLFDPQINIKIENTFEEGPIEQPDKAQEYPLNLIVPKSEKRSANQLQTDEAKVSIEITKLEDRYTADNETSVKCGNFTNEASGTSKRVEKNLNQLLNCESKSIPNVCVNQQLRKSNDLKQHLVKNHTKSDNVQQYICAHCESKLSTRSGIIQHLRRHDKPHKCQSCYRTFRTRYNMRRHIANVHDKVIKCPLCDFTCKTSTALRNHTKVHNDHPYGCGECGLKFQDELYLKHHMEIHKVESPHKCRLCDYAGINSGDLEQHIANHHTVSDHVLPHGCAHCGIKFSNKYRLIQHVRIHTGEKPYKCHLCDYASSTNGNLKLHITTHTGEKPFKCQYCEYACNSRSRLTKHVRTHTKEKPYKCPLCDYACNNSGGMKIHIRTHTGETPYKCQFCDYVSLTSIRLKKHTTIHTGEKPYKCRFCDYACRCTGNLNRHLKICHP